MTREKKKKKETSEYDIPIQFSKHFTYEYTPTRTIEREREKVKIILQGIYNFKSNYLVHIGIRNEIIDESVNMFDYGENEGMKYLFDMFINDCIRR